MAEFETISADIRERAGKGTARAARRAGRVPAVIYGDNKDPVIVTLDRRDVLKQLNRGGIQTRIFDVKTGDGSHRTLIRDIHFDPVSDQPIHIDFLRVTRRTVVTVPVPVVFLNEDQCPGLTEGGMLQVVRNEVDLVCPAIEIPEHIEVDLTGIAMGDTINFSNATVPDGIMPAIDDRDFVIANISAIRGGASGGDAADDADDAAGETGAEGGDSEEASS